MKGTLLSVLFLFGVVGCFSQVTTFYTVPQTGEGTYYGPSLSGGACSLDPLPSWIKNTQVGNPVNPVSVAMNANQFFNSAVCGMCATVTGSGSGLGANPITGPFVAYVADLCPECLTGDLDLGNQGDGRWQITWTAVACPVVGNMQYLFQGSNPFFIKLQARNTPYPIQSIIITAPQSVSMSRVSDNFFVGNPSTQLNFPITVKVTDIFGNVITDTITTLVNDVVIQSTKQFPVQGASTSQAASSVAAGQSSPAGVSSRAAVQSSPAGVSSRAAVQSSPAGVSSPAAGQSSPAAGQSSPAGVSSPAAGQSSPAAGQSSPAGVSSPAAGQSSPAAGQSSPAGVSSPAAGQSSPAGVTQTPGLSTSQTSTGTPSNTHSKPVSVSRTSSKAPAGKSKSSSKNTLASKLKCRSQCQTTYRKCKRTKSRSCRNTKKICVAKCNAL